MPTFKREDQEQMEKAKDLIEANGSAELGFVKSLFFGRIKADAVLPYPQQDFDEQLRTDELIHQLDIFMREYVNSDQIDTEERIPQHVIDGLGKLGVLGMTVPKQYGGGGFSHTGYCRVLEHVARYDGSVAVMVGAHQSIGLKALMLMGTEAQKNEFLPSLARGEKLAAFCLSEPEVGSDAANVQTTAKLSEDGQYWIINGDKRYATNAAIAGMMTVMAKTPVTDKNGKTRDKVTAFIVTPDLPGFQIVKNNRSKCGIRGTWQGVLHFDNMRVPRERVLGEVGKGLRVALSVLDFGRCTLSAGCLGGAKKALEMSIEHANKRRQFDRPIGEFHLIREKIACMAETVYAMDALTYLCAGLVDRHAGDIVMETAICKLFCSEGGWSVIDDAVQIFGGEGYMRDVGLERMLRDARINRIVEGATEVMTAFVALLGMKGVGEDLEHNMKMAKHPIGNFGRLAHFLKDEISDVVVGHSFANVHPELKEPASDIAHLTRTLARDIVRVLGKYREGILDMQLVQQRISRAVIELMAMTAVVAKLQQRLESGERVGRDMVVGKGYCYHAAGRIEASLASLFTVDDTITLKVAETVMKGYASTPSPPGRRRG